MCPRSHRRESHHTHTSHTLVSGLGCVSVYLALHVILSGLQLGDRVFDWFELFSDLLVNRLLHLVLWTSTHTHTHTRTNKYTDAIRRDLRRYSTKSSAESRPIGTCKWSCVCHAPCVASNTLYDLLGSLRSNAMTIASAASKHAAGQGECIRKYPEKV